MPPRFWFVGIAFLLITLGGPIGTSVYERGLETVEIAPDFQLTSTGYENDAYGDQVEFSLTDFRGKTVLLDFMAIACTSCRLVERQVIEPLRAELAKNPNFVLISIDTWADPESGSASFGGETNARLAAFQEEHGHDWRHALDTDKVFRTYDAIALPKLAVVGPEGQLVAEWNGQPSIASVRAAVERGLAGDASAATVFRLDNLVTGPALFLVLGAIVGLASFFAPCSVGLIPAYMGFLMQGTNRAGSKTGHVMRAGLTTGIGIVSIYAAIAVLLWMISAAGGSAFLGANLERIRPIMAVILVVFGLLMIFKVSWDWLAKKMGMGKVDGRKGFFAFGVGYGLAAFGCTGPLFLPILVAAFAESAFAGLVSFLAYSVAIAGFVVLAAGLVATGRQTSLRSLLSKTNVISRVSAVLLMGAGVWLLWVDWQAGVLF